MALLQFVFVILVSSASAKGRSGHSSHSYPHSTHLSGYGAQTHHISQSGGTGSHSYPQSGSGISGAGQHHQTVHDASGYGTQTHHGSQAGGTGFAGQHQQTGHNTQHYTQHAPAGHTTKTEVHHHYHYNPPQQIVYGTHVLPVYHGPPPVYVYEYRDSGSKFDTLLTGLALYNLGKMSASHHHHSTSDYNYRSSPGEICKLVISKSNGDYEETRIDCQLMSSFIWEAQAANAPTNEVQKNTVMTSVVTSTTTNGTSTSVQVTNTTVVDALSVKGPSLQVKPGMTCSLLRIARDYSTIKKTVDCEMLQTYAMSSMRRNSSHRISLIGLPQLLLVVGIGYQLLTR